MLSETLLKTARFAFGAWRFGPEFDFLHGHRQSPYPTITIGSSRHGFAFISLSGFF